MKMILLFIVKKHLHRTTTIRKQTNSKIPIKVKAVFTVSSKTTKNKRKQKKTGVDILWEWVITFLKALESLQF